LICIIVALDDSLARINQQSVGSEQGTVKSPQQSSDWLGPRASRPQRTEGAKVFSRFALIAGGTPAVPANHLTLTRFGSLSSRLARRRLSQIAPRCFKGAHFGIQWLLANVEETEGTHFPEPCIDINSTPALFTNLEAMNVVA
jgi:hypothetical protein